MGPLHARVEANWIMRFTWDKAKKARAGNEVGGRPGNEAGGRSGNEARKA